MGEIVPIVGKEIITTGFVITQNGAVLGKGKATADNVQNDGEGPKRWARSKMMVKVQK